MGNILEGCTDQDDSLSFNMTNEVGVNTNYIQKQKTPLLYKTTKKMNQFMFSPSSLRNKYEYSDVSKIKTSFEELDYDDEIFSRKKQKKINLVFNLFKDDELSNNEDNNKNNNDNNYKNNNNNSNINSQQDLISKVRGTYPQHKREEYYNNDYNNHLTDINNTSKLPTSRDVYTQYNPNSIPNSTYTVDQHTLEYNSVSQRNKQPLQIETAFSIHLTQIDNKLPNKINNNNINSNLNTITRNNLTIPSLSSPTSIQQQQLPHHTLPQHHLKLESNMSHNTKESSLNLDNEGFCQSKFIPFETQTSADNRTITNNNTINNNTSSIPKAKELQDKQFQTTEHSRTSSSPQVHTVSSGCVPLQRYQYEDVNINDIIYKKRINPYRNIKPKSRSNKKSTQLQQQQPLSSNISPPLSNINTSRSPPSLSPSPSKPKSKIRQTKTTNQHSSTSTHPKCMITVSLPKTNTQIDRTILSNNNNNRLTLSYKILSQIDNSLILYDGTLLKIQHTKTGYKIVSRYFQITKNCFRYYNSIHCTQSLNSQMMKPLVQFDIRHVADVHISTNTMLKYKYERIAFSFVISLDYSDNDVFEFGVDDPNFGVDFIKVLTLIMNYHDDMNNKNKFRYDKDEE